MSSLARRSLRGALTIAGVAVVSTGFTGTALAAPDVVLEPSTDAVEAPDLTDQTGSNEVAVVDSTPSIGTDPGTPDLFDVPDLFEFELPTLGAPAPTTPMSGLPSETDAVSSVIDVQREGETGAVMPDMSQFQVDPPDLVTMS